MRNDEQDPLDNLAGCFMAASVLALAFAILVVVLGGMLAGR